MNKKLTSFFVFALIVGFVGLARAGTPIADRVNTTTVWTATATVFSGSGSVLWVSLSTGVDNNTSDYAVVFDTAPLANASNYGILTAGQQVAPAYVFQATYTVVNGGGFNQTLFDYRPEGIHIKNGCWLYKTNANSGEARKVTIGWRKD